MLQIKQSKMLEHVCSNVMSLNYTKYSIIMKQSQEYRPYFTNIILCYTIRI